jgi:hypothetical protein
MFPLFMPMLIGAAGGALMNKKDPLKGALLGAGMGAAGGTLAPGLLGAGGGAATSATGGLLGSGAATGAGSQASMLAAQNAGFGFDGLNLLGQAAGSATGQAVPGYIQAGAAMQNGLGQAGSALKQANPYLEAVGTAKNAADMVAPPPEELPPPPQLMPSQPMDLSGILNANQQQMAQEIEEQAKRRQAMSSFAQYAMRG